MSHSKHTCKQCYCYICDYNDTCMVCLCCNTNSLDKFTEKPCEKATELTKQKYNT